MAIAETAHIGADDHARQLSVEYRPLDSLVPYARNARTHSDAQVAEIAGSIRAFGFTNPVLIAEDGTLIAGHGRVLAARKLGLRVAPQATGHAAGTVGSLADTILLRTSALDSVEIRPAAASARVGAGATRALAPRTSMPSWWASTGLRRIRR